MHLRDTAGLKQQLAEAVKNTTAKTRMVHDTVEANQALAEKLAETRAHLREKQSDPPAAAVNAVQVPTEATDEKAANSSENVITPSDESQESPPLDAPVKKRTVAKKNSVVSFARASKKAGTVNVTGTVLKQEPSVQCVAVRQSRKKRSNSANSGRKGAR